MRERWKGSISICHILYCLLHLTMKKIFFLKIHENDVVETLHKCFLTFHNCVLIDMQVGHQIEQVLIDFTTTKWHCLVRAGQIIHPHLFTPLLQILQSFLQFLFIILSDFHGKITNDLRKQVEKQKIRKKKQPKRWIDL